jgi:hypothetical protein
MQLLRKHFIKQTENSRQFLTFNPNSQIKECNVCCVCLSNLFSTVTAAVTVSKVTFNNDSYNIYFYCWVDIGKKCRFNYFSYLEYRKFKKIKILLNTFYVVHVYGHIYLYFLSFKAYWLKLHQKRTDSSCQGTLLSFLDLMMIYVGNETGMYLFISPTDF